MKKLTEEKSTEEKPTHEKVPAEAEPMETEAPAPKTQVEAGSQDNNIVIAQFRKENEQPKAKGGEMEASLSSLKTRLKYLQEGAKSLEPSKEKVADTEPVPEAVMLAPETISEASEEAVVKKPTDKTNSSKDPRDQDTTVIHQASVFSPRWNTKESPNTLLLHVLRDAKEVPIPPNPAGQDHAPNFAADGQIKGLHLGPSIEYQCK